MSLERGPPSRRSGTGFGKGIVKLTINFVGLGFGVQGSGCMVPGLHLFWKWAQEADVQVQNFGFGVQDLDTYIYIYTYMNTYNICGSGSTVMREMAHEGRSSPKPGPLLSKKAIP